MDNYQSAEPFDQPTTSRSAADLRRARVVKKRQQEDNQYENHDRMKKLKLEKLELQVEILKLTKEKVKLELERVRQGN